MNDDTMLGRGATAAFATRKPCKHGSLICFECEPIKEPAMSTTDQKRRVTFICRYCGSDQILSDAWAKWNVETQAWEIHSVKDNEFCEKCDGETSVEEVELVTP